MDDCNLNMQYRPKVFESYSRVQECFITGSIPGAQCKDAVVCPSIQKPSGQLLASSG